MPAWVYNENGKNTHSMCGNWKFMSRNMKEVTITLRKTIQIDLLIVALVIDHTKNSK